MINLFLRTLIVLSSAATALACSTDDDCNLNGVCTSGACVCDPGWKSANCGALDLRAVKIGSGYNLTSQGDSTWCNSIAQDPSDPKKFHMIAAQMSNGCTLSSWIPYSKVIRAVSTHGPAGPYTYAADVAPSFAHNPQLVYSPADKLYLIYHIGCPVDIATSGCKSKGVSCSFSKISESGVTVRSSPDLINWTDEGVAIYGDKSGTWDEDTTNPTAMPLYTDSDPTAEFVAGWRGCPKQCSEPAELIGLGSAPTYKGPFSHSSKPIFKNANEDPFIWRDFRGNFHLLLHNMADPTGPTLGRHAYARSWNGTWTFSPTTAYGPSIEFSNGQTVHYYKRERPWLYFSSDGKKTPLYLMNGVQSSSSALSYSLINPIGDGAAVYEASLGF